MLGKALAHEIIEKFGTKDTATICKNVGVKICYAKWFPSTIGEFDSKKDIITINLNANIAQHTIITHELGHYFIRQKGIKLTRIEEEKVVEDFVKVFL